MTTERLYYTDPYNVRFTANTVENSPDPSRVILDRSAFYPTSGGQPFDLGTLAGIPVVGVEELDNGAVVHTLAEPLTTLGPVEGEVNWQRRFDHMQQHTGQHLLSAVFVNLFGFETLSFHMGAEVSTVELGTPTLTADQMEAAERRSNELVAANVPVSIVFEDAATVQGLRKASHRTGTLRIVTIEGLDRSACGGTHVRSTGEIGAVLLRRTEKIRGNTRIEFVCGLRAARRARQDFRLLSSISETTSSAIDDLGGVVRLWSERLADAEKERRRLTLEVAGFRGRELYAQAEPLPSGTRLFVRGVESIGDDTRAEGQAFATSGKAAYIAVATGKPAVLLAVSGDSGVNAGNVLKPLLAERGGRGGGSAQVAQGSVSDEAALKSLVDALRSYF